MVNTLVGDIADACGTLDKKGGAHERARAGEDHDRLLAAGADAHATGHPPRASVVEHGAEPEAGHPAPAHAQERMRAVKGKRRSRFTSRRLRRKSARTTRRRSGPVSAARMGGRAQRRPRPSRPRR